MISMPYEQHDCLHNSRLQAFRNPQGACPNDKALTLRLALSPKLADAFCIVSYSFADNSFLEPMHTVKTDADGSSVVEATINLPSGMTGLLNYYFLVNDKKSIYYYHGYSGVGSLLTCQGSEQYQVTVYDSSYETPEWVRKGIMYQIFVDRFHKSSDRGGLDNAVYHRDMGRIIYEHNDWNEMPLYQPLPGENYYSPCDYYGGDLLGVIQKLPYLSSFGVTCIYLNPIFEANSNHKYNTSDYSKVDPMYGTAEDFRKLCSEAKKLGIRIILDGVFSHTGDDSRYFNRYNRYNETGAYQSLSSPYSNWYQFSSFPNSYHSWWGFETLPSVNEMDPAYLNFITNEKNGIIRQWLKEGSSGWRLDVADELPDAFIVELRKAIKAENPDGLLLGEVWEDASNKEAYGEKRQYVMGFELDSVMNYPLRSVIINFLLGRESSNQVHERISILRENYPKPFFYACMNLLSSHDVPRIFSLLGGAPDKNSGLSREQQADFSLSETERQTALAKTKLAFTMQMSLPGCPCIYYGDEAAMEGLMDPFCRRTYPWGNENAELQDFCRKLTQLRMKNTPLQTGYMVTISPKDDVFVVIRFAVNGLDAFNESSDDGIFISVINRSEVAQNITLDLSLDSLNSNFFKYDASCSKIEGSDASLMPNCDGNYKNELGDGRFVCSNGSISLNIEALSSMILQKM